MRILSKPVWVLDTNVVLDLLHFADPRALPILHALETKRIECRASAATLAELQRVLDYPEFGLTRPVQQALLARYRTLAPGIEAPPVADLPRCRDVDDQKFLELAVAAAACVLVSKDRALLKLAGRARLPFRILSPQQGVTELAGPDARRP
jgi:putative PIN family toxin of toxin-antitoxin system